MTIPIDPHVEALIFDLDGTVLDTMAVHHQAWRETVAPHGIDMNDELFGIVAGKTSHDIVDALNERFGLRLDAGTVAIAKDQAYVRHAPLIYPFPRVLAFLESVSCRYPLGAATNEGFGIANIVLRTTGLAPHFRVLVTADDVERPKPAPDIFLACAERLQVPPERCQVYEDSEYGILAAEAAGMVVTDIKPYL
ncbi:MAG: HAD family hydrolase [Alkalispirochaeta sp.]